jgi:recombination protein RecA
LRMRIGVMFGNPETTSGGNALKFYASVRLDIRRIQAIKAGGIDVGNRTRVKVKKNKVAPPFTECEFDIMYNEGISRTGDVVDLGVTYGVIDKRGAYFRYNDTLLGQGRENAKTFLAENPDMMNEMETLLREESGLRPRVEVPDPADDGEFVEAVAFD